MKTTVFRLSLLGLVAAGSLPLTSCSTTGDPSTGGIFWSEQKAQGRLAERQDKLERIESQSRKTERRSAETQRRINALQ